MTGTTITLSTKTGQRYEGVISSTNNEGDTAGVTLKDVKEISNPGAPLKDQLFIASTNIENWASGPADAKMTTNGDTFRTDTDISQKKVGGAERELQAWHAPSDAPNSTTQGLGGRGDEVTFGQGSNANGSWDQFAVNEEMFGVKTSFDEDLYTTRLDRNAADYKERERKAQKIANEIIGSTSSNPHIAEERGQTDDSGINEEDKYGAVVRGANAYVPPGARKTGTTGVPAANGSKTDVPKVSVNGPDGAAESPASSSKAASPAPSGNKPPADPLPAFRDFVTNEKQRLTQKRQALVKNEMDKRMAELVKFSQSFKLNKPIPEDLVTILAKDEDKQKAIRDKSSKDATSSQARTIGPSTSSHAVPARGPQLTSAKIMEAAARKPSANPTTTSSASAQKTGGAKTESAKPTKPMMFIQPIPAFKGAKPKQAQPATSSTTPSSSKQQQQQAPAKSPTPSSGAAASAAANAAAMNKLNVNASSFRPNPKASAFTPGVASPSTSNQPLAPSPKPRESGPPNPFFGARPVKKTTPVNVKDDFNPFKANKVTDPHSVGNMWPYSGKRYMQMFPPPQHPPQQHSPHMAPPMPPPMPPPSYEEDSAAQAAARGYMYYPPYYPGQPMMPGMPPPGPPGAFMPSPYMQHMPYPPGMPPPNGMYGPPGMGQMPPHQMYMPPPPPGTYPPPPNGAGPRPSMPPTPIPSHAHAHPYYQSPQLQHAVPYPMMMPPPNVPHPYEGAQAPPVQMGGHA